MDGARVVLVKPGDVLIFGNVGAVDEERFRPLGTELKEVTGVRLVVAFSDDIDLAAVSAAVPAEAQPRPVEGGRD